MVATTAHAGRLGTHGKAALAQGRRGEKALHIPLAIGRQLPRQRRAVGAAEVGRSAFFRAARPEMPVNKAFRVKRQWNFHENRPELPPSEAAIRGCGTKKRASCHALECFCHPIAMKKKKVWQTFGGTRKNAYLCSVVLLTTLYLKTNKSVPCLRKSGIFRTFAAATTKLYQVFYKSQKSPACECRGFFVPLRRLL